YYNAGGAPGACGDPIQDSDHIVALNQAQYNPPGAGQISLSCGATVAITAVGHNVTVSATIKDMCPGCGEHSLDLTQGLWDLMNQESGGTFDGIFPISW
ncbi:hypothetical protein BCR39DRAFT_470318, partial [Naematelia encephala]